MLGHIAAQRDIQESQEVANRQGQNKNSGNANTLQSTLHSYIEDSPESDQAMTYIDIDA